MFKLESLNNSHLEEIFKLNKDSKKVYGQEKSSDYDSVYEHWLHEIVNEDNRDAEALGIFFKNELIQYTVYYHVSTWPAVVLDHWRSSTKHKHKGIIAATEWTKLFADYIAKKGIYTWYIIVEKDMWTKYTKLQRERYQEEPPNYRFLLEEIPAGKESKFLSINTYLMKNQIYPKPMLVFQMMNKDKYY